MLGYLQTWWTHMTSHFDIPGRLEEASQNKFTRLWASSIITDPRTGDMSPPKSDSRDKTERKSLLASATSAVDDLISNLNSKQLLIVELALPIQVYEYLSSRVPTVDPYLHDDTVLSEPITTTSPYDTVIDPTIATPHSNMDYSNSAASAVLRNNNPMLAVP
ncbi:hypothetical protein D6C85_05606 [Aureobasidium pullulans]|uniref:Uncharacterized protein n=1 Tax=Aureobasidium pullulans TaxID=5580 RepID=A0A4S9WXR4_AURPU|nr:hypothetical protein D6C85_05606 [Aureobasidium pullulans]